ncbi:MAG: DUF4255 domain-containing protein [Crocinitomicaceae bacterium]
MSIEFNLLNVIFETLKILSEEVSTYLGEDGDVVVENVTKLDDPEGEVEGDVILTLLNIEEEKTLKNFPNTSVKNGRVQYKNPIVNLNLYLLFSGNNSSYTQSLRDISKIIEFFQGKRVFDQSNTNFSRTGPMLSVGNFHFTAELYTPSFEELNFIWGTLGGRQLPSVLYKVSIIEIERGNVVTESGSISESIGKSNSI